MKPGSLGNQAVFVPEQGIHGLAHGRYGPPHRQQIAFELVDFRDRFRCRRFDNLTLERLTVIAELIEGRIIAVDDGVDQTVGQVVGAHGADPAPALAYAFSNRIEAIAAMFLKGQHEALAEEEA